MSVCVCVCVCLCLFVCVCACAGDLVCLCCCFLHALYENVNFHMFLYACIFPHCMSVFL